MKQESTAGRESVATTDSRGVFKQAGCWLSRHGAFCNSCSSGCHHVSQSSTSLLIGNDSSDCPSMARSIESGSGDRSGARCIIGRIGWFHGGSVPIPFY